jgi:DNA replicative helicase MCM subunit Mcm2 (Cdc46/Mcm family)
MQTEINNPPNTLNIVTDPLGVKAQEEFLDFLQNATNSEEMNFPNQNNSPVYIYREQLTLLKKSDRTTFIVELGKLRAYNRSLYDLIQSEYFSN